MARFNRIRNLYDVVSNPKRYRNPDRTEVDLEETADPNTWRDETQATWREKLASRKRQMLLFGYFIIVGIGLFGFYSTEYFPGLTSNPWVIGAVKWGIVVPLLIWIGTRLLRSKLEEVDWLILLIATEEDDVNGLGFFVGARDEDTEGNATFQPLKGFSFMGLRGRRVTLGDLGDDFARQWSKKGRDASDPAVIRLEEALYQDRETFIGRITAVLTGGLVEDEQGQESDIYTSEPALVDPQRYRDLSLSLNDLRREKKQKDDKIDSLRDDRDHWKEEAMKTRKELRKEIVETHSDLAQAGFAPRQQPKGRRQTEGEVIMNGSGGGE